MQPDPLTTTKEVNKLSQSWEIDFLMELLCVDKVNSALIRIAPYIMAVVESDIFDTFNDDENNDIPELDI